MPSSSCFSHPFWKSEGQATKGQKPGSQRTPLTSHPPPHAATPQPNQGDAGAAQITRHKTQIPEFGTWLGKEFLVLLRPGKETWLYFPDSCLNSLPGPTHLPAGPQPPLPEIKVFAGTKTSPGCSLATQAGGSSPFHGQISGFSSAGQSWVRPGGGDAALATRSLF